MDSRNECADIVCDLPAKCIDRETSRYALSNVLCLPNVVSDGVLLAATDGRCLSVSLAEGTASGACMFPGALVEKITKPTKISKQREGNEWQSRIGNKIAVAEAAEGRFPRIEEVLPASIEGRLTQEASAENGNVDVYQATHEFVSINVELLLRVAQSITTPEDGNTTTKLPITLAIPHDKRSPVVAIGSRGVGIIMPITKGTTAAEIEKEHAQTAKRYGAIRNEYVASAARAKEIEIAAIEKARETKPEEAAA